jgi:hypothetical protein
MAKGFGIAGLVLAILSAFAFYGFNFAAIWLSMICSTVAALNGDRAFSIASALIAAAGLIIFSPITLAAIVTAAHMGDYAGLVFGFVPLGFPVVAILIDAARRSGVSAEHAN